MLTSYTGSKSSHMSLRLHNDAVVVSMGLYGFLWVFMGVCECLWVVIGVMGVYRYL